MMTFFPYSLLFLSLGFSLIVSFLYLILVIDSLLFGHDLSTSKGTTRALVAIIQKYNRGAKTFYDLGCAHGTLSFRLKKALPHLEIYALDNNPVRIFFAKLQAKMLKRKINFQKKDLFKTDLSNADVLYTYLWFDLMPPLEKKLAKELKPGALVITNTSHFQEWKPIEEVVTHSKNPDFEKLFVYLKK